MTKSSNEILNLSSSTTKDHRLKMKLEIFFHIYYPTIYKTSYDSNLLKQNLNKPTNYFYSESWNWDLQFSSAPKSLIIGLL